MTDINNNRMTTDKARQIIEAYIDINRNRVTGYGYGNPESLLSTCDELDALGLEWGDSLEMPEDFRVVKKYYICNSATNYKPEEETFYIEWNNGNVGRLQFVSNDYWYSVGEEWQSFLDELKSYNPVDYDQVNCHMIFKIADGKRLMDDYADICKKTKEKMQKKIRQKMIEKKKAELAQLLADND